jgi:mono/diheme cytochrome c family protein
MRRGLALALVVTFGLGAGFAAEASHFEGVPAKQHARVNPLNGKTEAVSAGGALYKDHCAECHQADGQGDGKKKPSLRSPQVRWAIIAYLRSLQ